MGASANANDVLGVNVRRRLLFTSWESWFSRHQSHISEMLYFTLSQMEPSWLLEPEALAMTRH